MAKIHYKVVEHDGGWAYKLGDVFSEAFPDRATALAAAKRVLRSSMFPEARLTSSIRMRRAGGTPSFPQATTGQTLMSRADSTWALPG